MRVVKLPAFESPRPSRAERLRREARNCLAIAVGQKDGQFAAELIDEAIRLTQRARELAA
jgi:hypothetical protein